MLPFRFWIASEKYSNVDMFDMSVRGKKGTSHVCSARRLLTFDPRGEGAVVLAANGQVRRRDTADAEIVLKPRRPPASPFACSLPEAESQPPVTGCGHSFLADLALERLRQVSGSARLAAPA